MAFLRLLIASLLSFAHAAPPVSTTVCNGKTFTFQELSGYGLVGSRFRDKYNDTVSLGSSIAIERPSWKKLGPGYYQGTLWMLPDRGWNTQGTTAYQPRIHKFQITLNTTLQSIPSPPNLKFRYLDTILFRDPIGNPIAGLDPTTVINFAGLPKVPAAKFTGDGFGGAGPGGTRMCMDPEGLSLDTKSPGGGFWLSDEYGPFIYHFDASGKLTQAIKPADAFIPIRKGVENFSSDNPPIYAPGQHPDPVDPKSGRANNQGFEGLTASRDGTHLYALLQSSLVQDGGLHKTKDRHTRLVKYEVGSGSSLPMYTGEYVVSLPQYTDPSKEKNPRTAAQNEILFLSSTQFLVLSRDSGHGRGSSSTKSIYRHIDIFDISSATSINKPKFDARGASITTTEKSGVLKSSITPAKYCTFLDMNNEGQLRRFGLHNGGAQDASLLNEKWESLAVMPVDGKDGSDGWWFVMTVSDNDFITQDGAMNFGRTAYRDKSGFEIDSQALVFKIRIPVTSRDNMGSDLELR